MNDNPYKPTWEFKVKRSWVKPPGHKANLRSPMCQICGYNPPFCCCHGDTDEKTDIQGK